MPAKRASHNLRPLRRLLQAHVERARALVRRARRRRLSQREIWERALPTEVAFWRKVLETKGLHWPWAYERGIDPHAPVIEPLVIERLEDIESDPIQILDVGAGPLTWLGTTYPGRRLEITAVDPLADEYDRLLADAGVLPPVRTTRCRGEDVLDRFGPDRFDIAYARNAIDHSADPLRIIESMFAVVKPGGFVLLRHYLNEAELERYEELHQWNFDVRDGRLLVWNRREEHDVGTRLGEEAELTAGLQGGSDHAPWVVCAIRKRRTRGEERVAGAG